MMTTRKSVGALMLYLSAQAAAGFAPEAAANEAKAVGGRQEAAPAPGFQRLVLADPSWDAFVFVSAATAIALELSTPGEQVAPSLDAAFAYQAAEPQFDYLAALTDVGIARSADAPNPEHHWLS